MRMGSQMPVKQFQCLKCGERIERKEPITNAEPQAPRCNFCGVEMEWAPTAMMFQLKGKGWTERES